MCIIVALHFCINILNCISKDLFTNEKCSDFFCLFLRQVYSVHFYLNTFWQKFKCVQTNKTTLCVDWKSVACTRARVTRARVHATDSRRLWMTSEDVDRETGSRLSLYGGCWQTKKWKLKIDRQKRTQDSDEGRSSAKSPPALCFQHQTDRELHRARGKKTNCPRRTKLSLFKPPCQTWERESVGE